MMINERRAIINFTLNNAEEDLEERHKNAEYVKWTITAQWRRRRQHHLSGDDNEWLNLVERFFIIVTSDNNANN